MRISLIHGENIVVAYEKYRQLIDSSKLKGFEIVQINDLHNIVSQSLFEEKVVFTVDRPKDIKPNDWKWLSKNCSKYNSNLLIFWEGNASSLVLGFLPKSVTVEKFDLPKILFNFLDSFYPGNCQKILGLLDRLVKNQPIELVFSMLARHLRDLYWVKSDEASLDYPDWRVLKLAKQAERFTTSDLGFMISELSIIDMKTKTGDSDLRVMLDLVIVKYLK